VKLVEHDHVIEQLAWARDAADRLDPLTNELRISQSITPPDGWIPDDPGADRIGRGW
jgi:hypothetical protein